MKQHSVVIAGGGPTGLTLAAELALAGVDVAIVERRANQELPGSRGSGLHARTIELFDQRGIADRFFSAGKKMQATMFAFIPLDISDFPTRHNYALHIWHSQIERVLAEWVEELRVPMYRSREVTGFTEDDAGVDVALSTGETLRAQYLVGCDGGRSVIRKAAGIDFPGWDATTSWIIAEVETTDEPKYGWQHDGRGAHAIGRSESGGARMVLTEPNTDASGEPTLDDLREQLVAIYGTDWGIRKATWISRFNDMTRQAASYRKGRILLAGDAANLRPPVGGQGLNLGVHDAMNLGWKLAQVVKGESSDTLLDTYHAERHPATARILRATMSMMALRRADECTKALNESVTDLLKLDSARKSVAGMLSGLDIHYDLGEGHPLLGRRMPDLDLVTANGAVRVFALLHPARPLLIDLGARGGADVARCAGDAQLVKATYDGPWELPVIGTVKAPAAVLVRPDGYVGWVASDNPRSEAMAGAIER